MAYLRKESSNTQFDEKEQAVHKKRCERAISLRKALRLTRLYFKEKYQISPSTLQLWENAERFGMSESGAQRLAAIYQQEGLNVTPEWLMYGMGDDPLLDFKKKNPALAKSKTDDATDITQELKLFYELNK